MAKPSQAGMQLFLKTGVADGFQDETQTQRTAFDQSAKAASGSVASAPSFSDSMDEAISGMKQAYAGIAKQKQKLMTEQTKLELRKELMSNSAIQELIKMRGELSKKAVGFDTKIEGSADIDPAVQRRANMGDLSRLVGGLSDVSGDIETRGTGILNVLNTLQKGQQQEYDIAKDQYTASRGVLSDMMDVGRYRMDEAKLPGALEEQRWDIQTKRQKAEGTEPLTPEQLMKASELGEGGVEALKYYQNRGKNIGIVPIIAGNPADTITNAFGAPTRWYKSHGGVDFKAKEPLPVGLPMETEVVNAGFEPDGGNFVTVRDADGYTYTLRHLSDISHVSTGMKIRPNDTIAISGNTGRMTSGAHVHLEMRNPQGKIVDPTKTTPPSMSELNRLLKKSSGTAYTKEQQATMNSLRDDIRQDPDIQNFRKINTSLNNIQSAAKQANGVGDLTLLREYAKLVDPSTGVREEEYQSMASAQGALARKGVAVTSGMVTGKQLTPQARQQFVEQAKNIYSQYEQNYKESLNRFQEQAQLGNVKPSLILPNITQSGGDSSVPNIGQTFNGEKVINVKRIN